MRYQGSNFLKTAPLDPFYFKMSYPVKLIKVIHLQYTDRFPSKCVKHSEVKYDI